MLSQTQLISRLRRAGFDPAQILVMLDLRASLAGCSRVLDVGCGPNSPLQHFGIEQLAGFDGWAPSLETARKNRTHQEFILGDIRQLASRVAPGQFDACIALDVIEHLPKDDGLGFLDALERSASRRVVLTTPNGFLPQGHTDADDLQTHRSGWDPADFTKRGYRVTGLLGPRCLRGEYHCLRHRPRLFFAILSLAAQLSWTRWAPGSAAALLACKSR